MSKAISSLAVGSKVKFGRYSVNGTIPSIISWIIVDKDRAVNGYTGDSVTVLSQYVLDTKQLSSEKNNNPFPITDLGLWLSDEVNGFTKDFTQDEKSAMPLMGWRSYDGTMYREHFSKVSLPSMKELGSKMSASDTFAMTFFQTSANTIAFGDGVFSLQAYENYIGYQEKVSSATTKLRYWSRDPYNTSSTPGGGTIGSTMLYNYGSTEIGANHRAYTYAFRPITNILNTTLVSDTVDEDGYYLVLPSNTLETISTRETIELATLLIGKVDFTKEATDTITVMACNNAYDDVPVWEDVTENILNKTAYNFVNADHTADKTGVSVKVTIKKAGA